MSQSTNANEIVSGTHLWTGTLHLFIAFDWGDEIDLEKARKLVPAELHELRRRRRTPASIAYRPPPLRFPVAISSLALPELHSPNALAEVTLFDFAAVSLAIHVPFQLAGDSLLRLAAWLADSAPIVRYACASLKELHDQLLPTIDKPEWDRELSEEYFVFQFDAPAVTPLPDPLPQPLANWLAGLLFLESEPLNPAVVKDALHHRISYGPDDLLVPNWAAAVLFDRECDETLQAIEFANLQLLEFRHIDLRLDGSLSAAYKILHPLVESRLPFWRSYSRPLRALGELKVEANSLFERTENVLKLVGDQYLARVYRLLATRFHLEEWEQNIQRKLEVAEGVYQVVSDQADSYRTEVLEVIVIVLILLEIVLALVRH